MEPIEFIVEPPPDGVDELLPAARRPRWLLLLVAAALVAGGISWALTRHSPQRTPTAASSSTLPAIGGLDSVPKVAPELPIKTAQSVLPSCTSCVGSAIVPKDVTTALTKYVAGASGTTVTTTVRLNATSGDSELVSRLIDSHIGSVDLLIRITPYQHPEPAPTVGISPTPPGLGSAFFRTVTPAYVIDIQWTGTDSTPPPVNALQSLADDPGLETLD